MRRFLIPLFVGAILAGVAYAYVQNRPGNGPLNGEKVARDIATRRAIAVILDNYTDARPQTGLERASLVYETLAEGGITRFMAVFLEHDAPVIGPVRSTRYYFNSWASGLGVIFGHDGGNVDALHELPTLGNVYNEDADRVYGPFYRVSTRVAPHNEYTSTSSLRAYAETHGGSITGPPSALSFKSDMPARKRGAATVLNIQFSYADYNVAWRYDPASNTYFRTMAGVAHMDAATGKQLTAHNVVVMFTKEASATDPYTPGAIHLRTEGNGSATVYEDGHDIKGTWSKGSVDGSLQWLDQSGNQVKLNRGNTWIEVVPEGNQVTVTPG